MENRKIAALALAIAILSLIAVAPVRAPPRSDLEIYFYENETAAWAAFLDDKFDLYGGMLTYDQYMYAITDPKIIVTPKVTTWTITNWALMNAGYDETTGHHEFFGQQAETAPWVGVKNPISDPNFRKALACLIDVARYLDEVYKGFGVELDVPITYNAQDPWANESLCDHLGGHYPFSYSRDQARYWLQQGGWIDWDEDGIINFPDNWPGVPDKEGAPQGKKPNVGANGYPGVGLAFFCYDSPEERRLTAEIFMEEFNAVLGQGVVNGPLIRSYDHFDEFIWTYYDYHIASDGWSVGRFPTYLYAFFHSDNWWPGYGGLNAYTPGEPDMDDAIWAFYTATSYEEAVQLAKTAQYYIVEKYCVWLTAGHSGQGAYAYKNLVGVVTTPVYGPWNYYTLVHATRVDEPGAPIRIGLPIFPPNLNQLTAMWSASYACLEPAWNPFITTNPFMPARQDMDMPWRARDWHDPGLTWEYGGEVCTVSKFYLDDRIYWVKPVTGENTGWKFSAADMEFTIWYFYQTASPSAWWRSNYARVHHVRTGVVEGTNIEYIETYFTVPGYFFLYYPHTYNQICKNAWTTYWDPANPDALIFDGDKNTPGKQPSVATFTEGEDISTPGYADLPFRTMNAPVDIISVVAGGTTLTKYTDYEIIAGRLYIYADIPDGTTITVTYWGRGSYVGDTVGGVPLTTIHYGDGPFYLISYDPNIGIAYKKNPHHFLETSPWGEVDWWWRWEKGYQKKRLQTGWQVIDIYDVVKIAGAYGEHGRYVPTPKWLPPADTSPAGASPPPGYTWPPPYGLGYINIYDVTSATGKYGTKFWILPTV